MSTPPYTRTIYYSSKSRLDSPPDEDKNDDYDDNDVVQEASAERGMRENFN